MVQLDLQGKNMVSISTLFIAKPVVRTALMISAFMVVDCSAEDWPQFLGPDRNGMSAETGLISSWPEAGLKPAWRAPLGEGALFQDRHGMPAREEPVLGSVHNQQ